MKKKKKKKKETANQDVWLVEQKQTKREKKGKEQNKLKPGPRPCVSQQAPCNYTETEVDFGETHTYCLLVCSLFLPINIQICSTLRKYINGSTGRFCGPQSPIIWSVSGESLPLLEWIQRQQTIIESSAIQVKDLCIGRSSSLDWPMLLSVRSVSFPLCKSTQR